MSYPLLRAKDEATQGVVDALKIVNFSKIPQIIFINTHSSCPDHLDGTFAYKGISAINLARQPIVKDLVNEQGVVFACTGHQWKYVPKKFPTMNVRYRKETGEVHTVPLYSYTSHTEATIKINFDESLVNLDGLNDREIDFIWDFISWRLGEEVSNKNHRLGFQKIFELSALADNFIDISVSVQKPKRVSKPSLLK